MYCKCAKGNNYQVIGLCDVRKRYPRPLRIKSSWVQITIPEILPIPECYPDIEELERIYINVVIESSRVIKTPISRKRVGPLIFSDKNKEGERVTGYKLVVNGTICQTVIYTADNCEQSLHSINFKFPFCTAIVLNPNDVREGLDSKFCVETCIEGVYAKALDEKTIFKSVTLFIEAKKAEPICCPGYDDTDLDEDLEEVPEITDETVEDFEVEIESKLDKDLEEDLEEDVDVIPEVTP